MNIGVFDSGLGGLTIFKELIKQLPEYDYIYLGDNARVPYGGRSSKVIYEFVRQAVEFLFKKDCVLIILACNTATAAALRRIQQEYLPKYYPNRRVLGVIRPTVEVIAESKIKRVGVIATHATVNSKSFIKEIHKLSPEVKVLQQAGPLLVPFIEEGETDSRAFKLILEKYLQPLIGKNIEALILGCTHYGLVKGKIQNIVGNKIRVICEGKIVAEKLKDYLMRHKEINDDLSNEGKKEFYITDFNDNYHNLFKLFLGDCFDGKDNLKRINLSSR